MDTHTEKFKIRLGLFVMAGLTLFMLAIFIIGKQKNLFNPVFNLKTNFHNVSGLKVGNNIRFSGINIGTVDNITIINDSTVEVDMLIKKEVWKFISEDCLVRIGSEGIIGDRLLIIGGGNSHSDLAKEGQTLKSIEPMEMDAILTSIKITAGNIEIITGELAEITKKINSGKGTLGRLIYDSRIAENLNQTIVNLKSSAKGLDENMQAAKHNFFLKGFFKKKEKDEEERKKSQSTNLHK